MSAQQYKLMRRIEMKEQQLSQRKSSLKEQKYFIEHNQSSKYVQKNFGEFQALMSAPQEKVFKSSRKNNEPNTNKTLSPKNLGVREQESHDWLMNLEAIVSYKHVVKMNKEMLCEKNQ